MQCVIHSWRKIGLILGQGLPVISRHFIKKGNVCRFSASQSWYLIHGEQAENEKPWREGELQGLTLHLQIQWVLNKLSTFNLSLSVYQQHKFLRCVDNSFSLISGKLTPQFPSQRQSRTTLSVHSSVPRYLQNCPAQGKPQTVFRENYSPCSSLKSLLRVRDAEEALLPNARPYLSAWSLYPLLPGCRGGAWDCPYN